jgi:murein DD-endopeptidase MepM/ murein hydrolase activator NlpD
MREEEVALGPTTNMGGTLGSPHAVSGEFPEGLGLSAEEIPPFGKAVFPVDRVPNWGVMRTPAEWDRSYGELRDSDFVPVPAYDLEKLAIPLRTLLRPLTRESISIITAKLFYSTRYFGSYDLDAREFTGTHAGVDLKLAFGTPIGAIGGGRVILVDPEGPFGLHVIIEHEVDGGDTYYSVYGHLSSVTVKAGSAVTAGQVIGEVGMAGNTTAPHLHLQVDRYDGTLTHSAPYVPRLPPTPAEANRWSVNPITFIQQHAN